ACLCRVRLGVRPLARILFLVGARLVFRTALGPFTGLLLSIRLVRSLRGLLITLVLSGLPARGAGLPLILVLRLLIRLGLSGALSRRLLALLAGGLGLVPGLGWLIVLLLILLCLAVAVLLFECSLQILGSLL